MCSYAQTLGIPVRGAACNALVSGAGRLLKSRCGHRSMQEAGRHQITRRKTIQAIQQGGVRCRAVKKDDLLTSARGWYAQNHLESHLRRKKYIGFRTSDAMQDEQERRVPRQQPLLQAAVKVHLGMALGSTAVATSQHYPHVTAVASSSGPFSQCALSCQVTGSLTRFPECKEQVCRAVNKAVSFAMLGDRSKAFPGNACSLLHLSALPAKLHAQIRHTRIFHHRQMSVRARTANTPPAGGLRTMRRYSGSTAHDRTVTAAPSADPSVRAEG